MHSGNNPVIEILQKYKVPVWKEIQTYLKDPIYPSAFKISSKYKHDAENYWQTVTEYPKRQGKYLRPSLLLLVYEAMGGKLKKALKTAAAMQISEEWILIHDDFEDQSLERRGKPTLQRMYSNELAVNAGDHLHAIMWEVITDNFEVLDPKIALKIAKEFDKIIQRTALGQGIEIGWFQNNKQNQKDEDWYFVCDRVAVAERKRRTDPNEFRSNVALGAEEEFINVHKIPEKMKEIAVKAAQILKIQTAGVDTLVDKQNKKTWLLEVNRGPGLTYDTKLSPEIDELALFFIRELTHNEAN